ncbi:MAG: hypothetical protein ABSB01_23335 [Streptosporangiaceae bacterium]|jgi:hypothetical protein
MTTTHDHSAASVVPQFARAGSLLEGLAGQDFAQLGSALAADARLRVLLPAGLRERTGAQVIADQFALWFGNTQDFDLVEAPRSSRPCGTSPAPSSMSSTTPVRVPRSIWSRDTPIRCLSV